MVGDSVLNTLECLTIYPLCLTVISILLYVDGDVGVLRKFIYMMLVDIHLCIADKRHPHVF